MKIKKLSKQITYWMGVVAVGLAVGLSLQFVQAWTEPAVAPPGGNVGAPINTSDFGQSKQGNLLLNASGTWANGLIVANGNVGIGTTSPIHMLDVSATSSGAAASARFKATSGSTEIILDANSGTSAISRIRFADNGADYWAIGVPLSGTDRGFRIYDWNGGTTPFYINETSGNVGIGTTSPQAELEIRSSDGISAIRLLEDSGSTADFEIRAIQSSIDSLDFYTSYGPKTIMTLQKDGNVGIGTNSPGAYKLAVNGSAAKIGGGSWSVFSDARLKDVAGNYESGLSEIIKLNPVRYNYKNNNALNIPADKEHIGLIAQEAQDIIPEAVEKDGDYLMLNNDPIIWSMVNAIKELKAENDGLRKRIELLENK